MAWGGCQGRQSQAIALRSPSLLLSPPPPRSREHQGKKLRDQIGYKNANVYREL